ncbi:MAG: hypothetical protein ABR536_01065 [Solirubrobacterales bacterium]
MSPDKKPLPRKAGSAKPEAELAKGGKPAPDLPARIDGLRGWLDQIERRQGRMSYFGAAGLLIALATAGVALYLGISAQQDDARKSDLDDVKAEISKVQTDSAASVDKKLKTLNGTIAALQQQVTAAEQQAQQAKQAAAASQSAAVAPPVITPPAPSAPRTPNTKPSTGGSKP